MAKPCIVFATSPRKPAFDGDEVGGNPFATALIRASEKPGVSLRSLLQDVRRQTLASTAGKQRPVWTLPKELCDWKLSVSPFEPRENRVALVLVAHDYSTSKAALNKSLFLAHDLHVS
jgi:hypothetical protein